jgi:hypothetical protein
MVYFFVFNAKGSQSILRDVSHKDNTLFGHLEAMIRERSEAVRLGYYSTLPSQAGVR